MRTLQQIWDEMPEKTDKGSTHSYLSVYEEILEPYRHTIFPILEIGIFNGASMKLWEEYFYNAGVYGVDCSDQPHGGLADLRPMIAEGTHNIIIADATSEVDMYREFKGMLFDVIIDDGNHNIISQLKSYEILSKYLSDEGLYVIEDIEDIDKTRELFEKIDSTKKVEILDRRHIKSRYDDVMVIIRSK